MDVGERGGVHRVQGPIYLVMNWRDRLTANPDVCHGTMCIQGTRIMASVVLDNLAAGLSPEEIVRSYPSITIDDVRATVAYAAELARERLVIVLPGAA